ncbi:MAG: LLM class F420-dependent oxidoreductase [Candidatus Geothermarchaeales archaeon]
MKFGVILPNYESWASKEAIVKVAEKAEGLGYDSVWSTDHVLVPRRWEHPYGHLFESLTTLSYVAGITEHVSLGTSILVLPARNPILVAKQVAALDKLSEGRVILGIGVGWLSDEFQMLRAPFHSRGRLANEAIRLMRILWTEENPRFDGEFYSFQDPAFHPKPAQKGGPPIWIAGNSKPALKRAARLGDGWHPTGIPPHKIAKGKERIRAMTERDVSLSLRLRVNLGGSMLPDYRRHMLAGKEDDLLRQLEEYAEIGLQHLACHFTPKEVGDYLEQMTVFASAVMPSF